MGPSLYTEGVTMRPPLQPSPAYTPPRKPNYLHDIKEFLCLLLPTGPSQWGVPKSVWREVRGCKSCVSPSPRNNVAKLGQSRPNTLYAQLQGNTVNQYISCSDQRSVLCGTGIFCKIAQANYMFLKQTLTAKSEVRLLYPTASLLGKVTSWLPMSFD